MNARTILDETFASWTADDRKLIAEIAADWTQLQARQLRGEDVENEIAIVAASIESLRTAAGLSATATFTQWIERVALVSTRLLLGVA